MSGLDRRIIDALREPFGQVVNSLTLADLTDPETPLRLVSPAFLRLTGFTAEQVIGRSCRFMIEGITDAVTVAQLYQFARGQGAGANCIPVLNRRDDGSIFHNLLLLVRVCDPDDRAVIMLAAQFDMGNPHAGHRLVESERMLRADLRLLGPAIQQVGLIAPPEETCLSRTLDAIVRLRVVNPKPD